ncbi:hypothetical protein [Dictyobacter kobayashii]|uniref:Uncharacterized protein n=1 Tax=Dictyobacter kobayashii TaxID=2014872 RepID=A0A402AEC9_9CHLR|nr:hypothetical protein [Dictyobacter kobayashii]GCE17445.1 hypothetical protein KDK_12450 [Dictyobacter kobayashii]
MGERIVHPAAEPARSAQVIEPETDDFNLGTTDQEEEFGFQEDQVEEADVPDMDLASDDEEEEEFFEEEEEEEEDDDMNWGRGRKKPKPTRATKPAVKKPGKRDTRRPY